MATKKRSKPASTPRPRKKAAKSHHRREPDLHATALGGRIRALRKSRGISFDALVGASGLGRGYVSEVERGLALPSVATLLRIADALGVPPAQLLERRADGTVHERLWSVAGKLSDESLEELVQLAAKLLRKERG